jgi:hypothetical protein
MGPGMAVGSPLPSQWECHLQGTRLGPACGCLFLLHWCSCGRAVMRLTNGYQSGPRARSLLHAGSACYTAAGSVGHLARATHRCSLAQQAHGARDVKRKPKLAAMSIPIKLVSQTSIRIPAGSEFTLPLAAFMLPVRTSVWLHIHLSCDLFTGI